MLNRFEIARLITAAADALDQGPPFGDPVMVANTLRNLATQATASRSRRID